ncbi:MAG: alpha-galactosidase [Armatimonadetes bacterium]|nr:alpha-galactosidase [Armatimonadota bacterium]
MTAPQFDVRWEGDAGPFEVTLLTERCTDGVEEVQIILQADAPFPPPPLALRWSVPVVDIQSHWTTAAGWNRGNGTPWSHGVTSKATSNAPVVCLHNLAGRNRLTFAFSDALNAVRLTANVVEETARFDCALALFPEPGPPVTHYTATLRLDTRDVPYWGALGDVQAWWASLPGCAPSPVPEVARQPMYSTWYSFHQSLTLEGIETQCRLAKEIGCEAMIVDDGWQTADSGRGYAYCGDWEASPARIPDMKAHVARVHDLGLKYLLWYSVPFVGVHSKAWGRFHDTFLTIIDMGGQVGVLDPRFPEVREYLITTYERAVRDWDLDGLKLDFVDSFHGPAPHSGGASRRDYASVPEAVDRLLTDVMARLRAIKPDIMIEFRQSYVGPLMRKYGNMFRAGDCPDDALTNRQRTLDIRLLCGDTAAHADMMMWHPDEPTEAAALQLINTLFAVPQISVLLDQIPPDHLEMVRWWLAWWKGHRGVLLDGSLTPLHPEAMYPVVIAADARKKIIAAYADAVLPLADAPGEVWIVNGTPGERLVLELPQPLGDRTLTVRDCRGRTVREEMMTLSTGPRALPVPPSGTIHLSAPEGDKDR